MVTGETTSDHLPVQPLLPRVPPAAGNNKTLQPGANKLQLGDIAEEQWVELDEKPHMQMDQAKPKQEQLYNVGNISRYFAHLEELLLELLSPLYRTTSSGRDQNPMGKNLARNADHPRLEGLENAVDGGRPNSN